VPSEGDIITINLPGEMIRAVVERVSSDDAVVARIDSIPMAKGHLYKKNDIVPARRIVDDFLKNEQWEIVSDRELNLAEAADRFDRQEKARVAEEQKGRTNPVTENVPPTDNWSA